MHEWRLDHDFNDILKSSQNSLRRLKQSKILLTDALVSSELGY